MQRALTRQNLELRDEAGGSGGDGGTRNTRVQQIGPIGYIPRCPSVALLADDLIIRDGQSRIGLRKERGCGDRRNGEQGRRSETVLSHDGPWN